MVPLYSGSNAPPRPPAEANLGLWYNKFGDTWNGARKNEQWKRALISSVTGVKQNELLQQACARLCHLSEALHGEIRCLQTNGRFVTGLGREHPIENGFAWHHTLGVPYLAGSSVKGVVRAWAQEWREVNEEDLARIFGGASNGDDRARGSVIFFDALPYKPPKLEEEVMTPHYSEYYRKNGPPADWYSPTPIPFLTVAARQPFIFGIAPVGLGRTSKTDVDKAMAWLVEALEWIGAGAKTAVGYGRFVLDDKITEELRLSARTHVETVKASDLDNSASPIRREMDNDGYASDKFMEFLTRKWLGRMDAADTSEVDRREIAKLLAEWYQRQRPTQWTSPSGKNEDKVRRIKDALAVRG